MSTMSTCFGTVFDEFLDPEFAENYIEADAGSHSFSSLTLRKREGPRLAGIIPHIISK